MNLNEAQKRIRWVTLIFLVILAVLLTVLDRTGNLDSAHGDEVMKLLTGLNEDGTTIIMVTHSPAYADYAHRTVHLFDGHIVSEDLKGKFHI